MMKEILSMFSLGIFFGAGVTIGGLIAWMLVPNGKGLREEQKRQNEGLMALLNEKNDILESIKESLDKIAQRID